jgi:uncharacterized protein
LSRPLASWRKKIVDICINIHILWATDFSWDERKRKDNVRQHGFDFADAGAVFEGFTLTVEDDRFSYGEQRFIPPGMLKGTVVVIAHTERNEVIRVISMRKATRNEQKIFFEWVTD